MKIPVARPLAWCRSRIVDPCLLILKRGTEPKQLAVSAALGITIGIFPICGVTVFICGFVATVLGPNCHTPTLMLSNFVATPLELSMIVPFLRIGEWIVSGEHFEFSPDALKEIVTGRGSLDLLLGIFHAILGWTVTAPLIFGSLYTIFHPIFRYSIRKLGSDHWPLPTYHPGMRLGEFSPRKEALA
eukprot:c20258_g1_i1 orf=141-701(+)